MESTKERILRIATDLFVEHGFHGTGIAEISEKVGLGKGALYHHITSKDKLHAEIAYAPIRAAVAEATEIRSRKLAPEQTILELSNALSEAIRVTLNPWIVFFREFSSLPAEDREQILELRETYLKQWSETICEGVNLGLFREETPLFLDGLLPMFIYVHIWETNRGGLSRQDIGGNLGSFVLHSLRQ